MSSLPIELPPPGQPRQRDGYSVSVRATGLPMLGIARWSDELEAMLDALPEVSVGIAGSVRGVFADLPRLAPYAERIVAFSAHEDVRGDLSLVNGFTNLRELSTSAKAKGIALRSFTRLWRCLLDGTWDLAGLAASAGTLEELHLEGGKAATLAELAPLHALRKLDLWSTNRLESLDGVEGLPIEELKVHQARALRSVRAVASLPRLRVLSLDAARGIADLDAIGDAAVLEELTLVAAGTAGLPSVASVAWLAGLTRLRYLHLDASVEDGDLAAIAALPALRDLRLGRHRQHHSHTPAQLRAVIEARSPEIVAAREARDRTPSTVGGLPTLVLRDVPWRFSASAATRDEVIAAVEAELREDGGPVGWDADALVLPAPRLRVRVPGFGEGEAEDWSDEDALLELAADDARGFTAAELLLRLHEAARPLVGHTDYRHFEGLALDGVGDDGAPTYELRLGS